jgi:hypothetical protein
MFTNGPGSVDAKSLSWSIVGPDFVSIDGDGILTAGAGHFIGAEGATVTVVAKAEGYDGSEGGAAVEARRSVLLVRELSALRVTDVTVRRPNGSQARSVPLTTDRITVPSGHLLSFSVTAEFTDGSTEIVSSGIEWSWKGVGIDPGRLTTANPAKATFRATAPGEVDVRGSYTHGYAGETRSRIATVGVSVVSPSARAWKHPSVRWKARNALPDTP